MFDILKTQKHSPIHNYGGIPGLTSFLIGEPSEKGIVRLMECSRDHFEPIIPHSHRFDFDAMVLAGKVSNIIWTEHESGDDYQSSTLHYSGKPGEYVKVAGTVKKWRTMVRKYYPEERYSMKAAEVHSIFFTKGTSVLFFEGPQTSTGSMILQPWVNGEVVPTFKVEPWMFKKENV